jgi:hypothetical protein
VGLASGTVIGNRARIVFDLNPHIDTNEWQNMIDRDKPVSAVAALPATQASSSFQVQWGGTDQGTGIGNYSIFVSENGGPYQPWFLNTPFTTATFVGQGGRTYTFYSVARDAAGNLEDVPAGPDATTLVPMVPRLYLPMILR